MSLVVFTGAVGLAVAPGHLHPVLAVIAVLCIAIGAGASGAINMWYDRDIDAVMERTRARPIPAGRMDRSEEHTSEIKSLMRRSYAVFCLKKKKQQMKHY